MKKVLILLLPLLFSCNREVLIDSGSSKDAGTLSVRYTLNGAPVDQLAFNAGGHHIKLNISVNNERLGWRLVSDKDWCVIDEKPLKGSAEVAVDILANRSFEDREDAFLTFKSSDFEGFTLRVSQSGSVFLCDKNMVISSKKAGNTSFTVTVPVGTQWDTRQNDWLDVSKGSTVVGAEEETTIVTVAWPANTEESRFGIVELLREGESDSETTFTLAQTGSEFSYNADGSLYVEALNAPALSFDLPFHSVLRVEKPDFVQFSTSEVDPETTRYTFTCPDNPSDCRTTRAIPITLILTDSGEQVPLPAIVQDWYPAGGLISGAGMKLLAETWNAGEDIGEWMQNGEIVVLNNLDFSAVDSWTPMGTETRPFNGIFNGKFRKVLDFHAQRALFGVCDGATLKDIIIDASSSFSFSDNFDVEYTLAPLAEKINATTINNCDNAAPVSFSGKSSTNSSSARVYVAGLVGTATGESKIENCDNSGNVTLSAEAYTYQKVGAANVGGIVALNKQSTVSLCSNSGLITDNANIYYHLVGGIAGASDGNIELCVNQGALANGTPRKFNEINDYSYYVILGGLAGNNCGNIAESVNYGPVNLSCSTKYCYGGGVCGAIGITGIDPNGLSTAGLALSNNKNAEEATINSTGAARYIYLGGLYGSTTKALELTSASQESVSLAPLSVKGMEQTQYGTLYVGGLLGYSNKAVSLNGFSSSASITMDFTGTGHIAKAMAVGGVVGYTTSDLTLSRLAASGNILFKVTNADTAPVNIDQAAVGGILAWADTTSITKPMILSDCTSRMRVSFSDTRCGKSNGKQFVVGGIAGVLSGKEVSLQRCRNEADLINNHYSNTTSTGAADYTGGIVGRYRSRNDGASGQLNMDNCQCSSTVESYRGGAGGIIGFGRNMQISNCSMTGSMTAGSRAYVGGIGGFLQTTRIENCTVKSIVGGSSAGGQVYRGGGIAGILSVNSVLTSSSYYGDVKRPGVDGGEYAGGLVGNSDESSAISGNRFGGTVASTVVTADNVSTLACGNSGQVSDNNYWDGK